MGQCVTKLSPHNFACMWYIGTTNPRSSTYRPYQLFRVVTERDVEVHTLSSVCGRGRPVVETSTSSVSDQGHKKWDCLKTRVVQQKTTLLKKTWCFLFPDQVPPPQGSQRKTIHIPSKTPFSVIMNKVCVRLQFPRSLDLRLP